MDPPGATGIHQGGFIFNPSTAAPAAQQQGTAGGANQQPGGATQQQGFNFTTPATAPFAPQGQGGFTFQTTQLPGQQFAGFDPQVAAMAWAYMQMLQKPISKPAQEFPKWDGSESTRGVYIERLKNFQQDPFFNGARWDMKDPAFETQSNYLRGAIFAALPLKWLDPFRLQPRFETDGFAMFSYLLELLSPDTVETRLIAIVELSTFEHKAGETVDSYFARGRELHERLLRFRVDEIMPLLMLVRLNHDNFPGLQERIANADKDLMNADMANVEQLVRRYEQMQKALGISPGSTDASARRSNKNPEKKPPAKEQPPPPTYPPPNFNWNAMYEYLNANKDACPGCYHKKLPLHRKIGCHALAKCNFVLKYDPDGAKIIGEEHNKLRLADKKDTRQKAKRASEDGGDAPEEKVKEDDSQASAKRSTAKRSQAKSEPRRV
jgi:hypothetical protein